MVFIWRLIGLEHGASFLDQSQMEVSQNQRTPASPFRLLKITLKTSKVIISLITALNGKNKRGD